MLVDHDAGLVRLLDPPLVNAEPSAGYIQAYPPGVRENGGQYSHAGVWAAMAQAALGDGDAAYRYFTYLSPAHRSRHAGQAEAYEIEPYVMAGDVYSAPPYVGRGGWSWYTGSAAWMHRAAIEAMFGVSHHGDELVVRPCLPSAWREAELRLTRARQDGAHPLPAQRASRCAGARGSSDGGGRTAARCRRDRALVPARRRRAAARPPGRRSARTAKRGRCGIARECGMTPLDVHVLQPLTRRSDRSREPANLE